MQVNNCPCVLDKVPPNFNWGVKTNLHALLLEHGINSNKLPSSFENAIDMILNLMNEDQLKEQASILSTSGSKNSSEPTPPLFEDSHSFSDWKRFIKSELAVSSRMNDDHDGFFNIFTHNTARNARKTIYQRTIQVYQTKASSDSTYFSSSLKYLFQAHSQTTRFTKQRIKSLIHAGNKGLWHMFLHHELEELIEYCNSLESQKDCRVLKQIFETVLLENSAIASVPPGHNIEPYKIISNSRQIQKRPIFEDNCTYQTNILFQS